MAATFTPVLSPPQTLETLDVWSDSDTGGLDALPWSLDSAVWNTAGIYALTATETGRASGTLVVGRRLHGAATGKVQTGGTLTLLRVFPATLSAPGNTGEQAALARARGITPGTVQGLTSASATWLRTREDTGTDGAASGATLAGWLTRLLELNSPAVSFSSALWLRTRRDSLDTTACSAATLALWRVRLQAGGGYGTTGNAPFELIRLRGLDGLCQACSGEALALLRILHTTLDGHATTDGAIQPEYKGWGWQRLPAAPQSPWVALRVTPPGCPDTDFNDIWQKVVQWQ